MKKAVYPLFLMFVLNLGWFNQPLLAQEEPLVEPEKKSWVESTGARQSVVVDAGLAALRKSPTSQGELKQRLRVGRKLYVLSQTRSRNGQVYYWVAVTRRTRGWIDARALARSGTRGDDVRLWKLISAESNHFEQVRLCQIFFNLFKQSKLTPQVLWQLAETAEAEAKTLNSRIQRRAKEASASENADLATYIENDVSLDRYNRLGVVFKFHPDKGELVYDGWALRQLQKRFPKFKPE
jgi:hypothetical protein